MTANATIIRIGNSNGLIIPAKLLKSLALKEKDAVSLTETGGGIVLKKIVAEEPETPFSALDKWNHEHGYGEESVEEALSYIEAIRKSRVNKEISEW